MDLKGQAQNYFSAMGRWMERTFLGPKNQKPGFPRDLMAFMGEDLGLGHRIVFQDIDVDERLLSFFTAFGNESPALVFITGSETIISGYRCREGDELLLLFPPHLEAASPMAESLVSTLSRPAIIVFVNLSRLVSAEEMAYEPWSFQSQEAYSHSLQQTFINIYRQLSERELAIVVIENQEILGQKNSAFLQRLFCD